MFWVSMRIPFLQLTSKQIRFQALDLEMKKMHFVFDGFNDTCPVSVRDVDEKEKPLWTDTSVADVCMCFFGPWIRDVKKNPDPR